MLKRFCLSFVFLLAGSSSLFAFGQGSFMLYPQAGIGLSPSSATGWSADELNYVYHYIGYNTDYEDAKRKAGLSWSIGCGFDYGFTDSIALTSGLFIDRNAIKIIYESNNQYPDLDYEVNFLTLTVPLGIRFYGDIFLFGGGFYLGVPMQSKVTEKTGGIDDTANLDDKTTVGIFIDAGINIDIGEENTLLVFLRYKNDLNPVYDVSEEYNQVSKITNRSLNLTIAYGFSL